jgi:hypothetical protein
MWCRCASAAPSFTADVVFQRSVLPQQNGEASICAPHVTTVVHMSACISVNLLLVVLDT